jgi:hypothetical protein
VATRRLAPPEGGSDEPEEGEDHRGDPKDVEGETGPREDQHNEEKENENHVDTVPIGLTSKRERHGDEAESGASARPDSR